MSIFNPLRDNARKVAEKFSLEGDTDAFNELWNVKKNSDDFEKDHHEEVEQELANNLNDLKNICNGNNVAKPGFQYTTHIGMSGRKFVIFSDHHIAFNSNRQNWFVNCGNRELYMEALQRYYDSGYTLIENGDVEELLIFEPQLEDAKARAKMSWNELDAHRSKKRLAQLDRILADNSVLYTQIAKTFVASGRYFRTVGNHDHDLQKSEFLSLYQQKAYPKIAKPSDFILLEQSVKDSSGINKVVKYVIGHGHQFDKSCTPKFASKLGEAISESLSWAYQGPDRRWRWKDGPEDWATGDKTFTNRLVTDNYKYKDSFWNDIWFGLGAAISTLNDPDGWEYLFKHNVAWEYFENTDPQRAISDEVKTGNEFFKYRHMDEKAIKDALLKHFPNASSRPSLVLGHSHEPRFNADGFASYYNTASAGRFQNLIWALEIEASGKATLVSWSRKEPKNGTPLRSTYTSKGDLLIASASTNGLA